MTDYELANLLIEQDNEYLKEKWREILDSHIIYVNSKEIKKVILEELSSDWELFFLYFRHKNDIEKVVKILKEDLRKNGIRYISKYVIPDLFKKMLREYVTIEFVKKNKHRLYSLRKRQRIKNELKIFYIKQ